MRESFSNYHPIVNMLYFTLVMGFSMFFTHPICLGTSFVCAFSYSVYLKGRRALKFGLVFMLPTLAVTALLNPAFNHEGETILTYLPDGNPLTLESIIYGIVSAVMLLCVINWFSCYNEVMTSDKLVYLFGRVIPAMSLILSMALRLAPRFKAQLTIISNAQRCIGRDPSKGGVIRRARQGIGILSVMVTWALENSIETADSMKSRGYGLPGRTAFSIFHFDRRDLYALVFIVFCGGYILAGVFSGGVYFRYFPTIKGAEVGLYSISLYITHLVLAAMPLFINIREAIQWKAIQSGI